MGNTYEPTKSTDSSNIKELIREELYKCATDYDYGIKKYFKIEHPMLGKVPFQLYNFQSKTLKEIIKSRFSIILKSRQMGISTLVAAYALINMLFKENYKVLVIATNQDVAMNLVHKVQVMYQNLPAWLKIHKITSENMLKLTFGNGSTIKAVASSKNAGRSEALSLLIIDEFAFIDGIDDIWASSQMTLATGGEAIVLSTPNGVDNLFHKLWTDSEEQSSSIDGLEPFNPIRLPWHLHPDRDETWRKQQNLLLGERIAAQECDTVFTTSGHTVIESEYLNWIIDNTIIDPIEKRGQHKDYWIYKYPEPDKQYIISVDVARGDGEDDSAIEVFDAETMEQCAEYIGKIPPKELGKIAVSVGIDYNNGLLVIDNRNIGFETVQVAIDLNYTNLYYSYRNDNYIDPAKHIVKEYDLKPKSEMVPGLTITSANRPILISKLERYCTEKTIIIHSKRLINQLQVFMWSNGKAQARSGRRDDAVIATCMVLYVRETALRLLTMGIENTKKALENTFKTIVKTEPIRPNNPWDIPDGHGKTMSIRWLI